MEQKKESELLGYNVDDPEQLQELALELKDRLLAGESAREALQISEEEMETMYCVAYRKYQHGDFKAASQVFRFLVVLDGQCYKYLLGMAASVQRLGEYNHAANYYLLASFYEPNNPIPYFHAAKCFLALGMKDMATTGLHATIFNAGNEPEYAELKERAKLILNNEENNEEK